MTVKRHEGRFQSVDFRMPFVDCLKSGSQSQLSTHLGDGDDACRLGANDHWIEARSNAAGCATSSAA